MMNLFNLTGRNAVVTGAASGIGRAIAVGLARAGANVALADLNATGLPAVADEIAGAGRRALVAAGDVTDEGYLAGLMARTRDELGSVDIAVPAAGINVRGNAAGFAAADYRRVIEVNLVAVFLTAQAAGRFMIEQGRGSIVLISSVMGHVAAMGAPAYASSKGGVSQLARTLALEWAHHHVRVNALCPGYVRTPFIQPLLDDPERLAFLMERTPMKRLAEPEELVGPAVFLASDAASYVTGTSLFVDGGWVAW